MATATLTLKRNVICLVEGVDTAQLMEKLHQLTQHSAEYAHYTQQ